MAQNDTIAKISVNAGGNMHYASGIWQSGQLTASALVRYVQGDKSANTRQQAVTELLSNQKLNNEQIQFVQSQFEKDVTLYQELLTDKRFATALQHANDSVAYVPADTQSPVSERFINSLIERNTSELTADEIRKLCTLVSTKEAVFPNGVRFGFQREALLTQFITNANESVLCADLLKDFVATDRPCEFILDDGGVKARKAGGLYAWRYQQRGNQIQYTNADIQLKSNVFDETIYHEMRHHVTTPKINDALRSENENPIYHFISEVDTCAYDCFFDERIRNNKIVSSIIENAHKKADRENADLTQVQKIRLGNNDARRILMSLYLKSPEERIDYYKELRKNGYIDLPPDFDKVTAKNKAIPEDMKTDMWYHLNDIERLAQSWVSYYAPNYVSAMKANLDNSGSMDDFVAKYHSQNAMTYLKDELGLEGVPSRQFAQFLAEKYLKVPQNREQNTLATYIQNGKELDARAYLASNPQMLNQSMYVGQGTLNMTPLHYSLNQNQLNIAQALLQNQDIDLTIKNENNETPFGVLLMQFGQNGADKQLLTEMAQTMITQNAPISVQNNIALFNQTVRTDNPDIVRYVLNEYKDWYSLSPVSENNPLATYINYRQSFDSLTLDENIVRQLVDFGISPQASLPAEVLAQLQSYPFKDETLRMAFASQTPPPEIQNNETEAVVSEPVTTDNSVNEEQTQPTDTDKADTSHNEMEIPVSTNTVDETTENTQTQTVEVKSESPTDNTSSVQSESTQTDTAVDAHKTTKKTKTPQTPSRQVQTTRSQPVVKPRTSVSTPPSYSKQTQSTSASMPAQTNSVQSNVPQTPQNIPTVDQSGVMPQSDNLKQVAQAEADKQSFLERNWQWLAGLGIALAIGIGAYFLIRKQKKKTKKAESTVSELNSEVSSLKDKLNAMQTQQNTDTSTNNGNATNTDGIIGLRPIISDDTYNR